MLRIVYIVSSPFMCKYRKAYVYSACIHVYYFRKHNPEIVLSGNLYGIEPK